MNIPHIFIPEQKKLEIFKIKTGWGCLAADF